MTKPKQKREETHKTFMELSNFCIEIIHEGEIQIKLHEIERINENN